MAAGELADPLQLNLRRQLDKLADALPEQSPYIQELRSSTSTSELLASLSKLLALPSLTRLIATLFRPLLIDLCTRWLEKPSGTVDEVVALCLIIENHEEIFPILYELLTRDPFTEGVLQSSTITQDSTTSDLHKLLLAYYRILQANRNLPRQLYWSLEPLHRIIWTPNFDNGSRLLAIQCYALQSRMVESEREQIEKQVFGDRWEVDCSLQCGEYLTGETQMIDGWLLPVLEIERIDEEREEMAHAPLDFYLWDEPQCGPQLQDSDLSPRTANIHGVMMLKEPGVSPPSPLVTTSTTKDALQSISLNLSLRAPILITSPPSSGKSLLISHLANTLHPRSSNQVVTIYLGDTSLDPRSLFGSYVSSQTRPGSFDWKDGVLVKAMREGKWVVFKDIDKGSPEVLGTIKPLIECFQTGNWIGSRAEIQVPSRGRVLASQGFAVFATRSVSVSALSDCPLPTFFGSHKFHEVKVSPPNRDDLAVIVNNRFPRLAGAPADAIIDLWSAAGSLGSVASSRVIGLRELEKFCARAEKILPTSIPYEAMISSPRLSVVSLFPSPSVRERLYLEARDVFFGAGVTSSMAQLHMDSMATVVGEHLGLDHAQRQSALRRRSSEFQIETDSNKSVTAIFSSHICLSALKQPALDYTASPPTRPFALHKSATALLSRIITAVHFNEPILLTGETGTGKTSAITHLSSLLRRPLVSLNLSQQTESSDLLGGFKPVDARVPGSKLYEDFMDLFGKTFSKRKNEKFEKEVRKAVQEKKWKRAAGLWKESTRLALERIRAKEQSPSPDGDHNSETPRKRRKVLNVSAAAWNDFAERVQEFEVQHIQSSGKLAFDFVEGPLVRALRSGNWVLLDEINLASSETLECISGLLQGPTASITLTEQGSLEPVPRHPDFRLFACMNPASDVGKKDLVPSLRSRFTEIDVPSPDSDRDALLFIIDQYIGPYAIGDKGVIMDVANFHTAVKRLAMERKIADGSNHRPHYSIRTLARALTFAADTISFFGNLRRALWEGCLMAFTMMLDKPSKNEITSSAEKHLLSTVKNSKSLLSKEPSLSSSYSPEGFVKFGAYYIEKGPLPEDPASDYVLTPSVRRKLADLARTILTRRMPVLIEGPTSAGKTSSIEYLARRTGHRFIRINNHEHTDIQEYIGSYITDAVTGKLVFKDGLLVRALRNGDWIVLDELNLAPTDVLEALNRLLDDNRELFVAETNEIIRPHPHFMLFATQNPPGLYAGRKLLSRAFRNRFMELYFDDVPQDELMDFLHERCQIAPSYAERIIRVFLELQKRRQSGRVFESRHSFATLRDLFRWAGRDAVGYQQLAENGYMLLAERARRDDDKNVVQEVVESIMGVKIKVDDLYNLRSIGSKSASYLGCDIPYVPGFVWTKSSQRLFVLVSRALQANEPVLLVGETGSGKTSVCQVYADATKQHLRCLNCHQNTETADLIGGLRPVRNRSAILHGSLRDASPVLEVCGIERPSSPESLIGVLKMSLKSQAIQGRHRSDLERILQYSLRSQAIFDWYDGPLVEAMHSGDVFLMDEISLADDSVLERLNSVLEPGRTIVLAENGSEDLEMQTVVADEKFKLIATMNPGGDYGKKELSPALRNRFTEIWVPQVDGRDDLELIIDAAWSSPTLKPYTSKVLDFFEWLGSHVGNKSLFSLRDVLSWIEFSNAVLDKTSTTLHPDEIFHQAAHLIAIDGLATFPHLSARSKASIHYLQSEIADRLRHFAPNGSNICVPDIAFSQDYIRLGPFSLSRKPVNTISLSFSFSAPTTRENTLRIIRALQLTKPILLEGSPGVGKTTLIMSLAKIVGCSLTRINLSDQTDIVDLFGSDLPTEDAATGEFSWKDGEFLRAMQEGHWVLLDEMNLAPQPVLEGLNAVLDHRGAVYIPELNRSFRRHPDFRIFAAQNPIGQGGARKGLPKSFLNRFSRVYVDELTPEDLYTVCRQMYPGSDINLLKNMISFNDDLLQKVAVLKSYATEGAPWEFNLRDIMRWLLLLRNTDHRLDPSDFLNSVYLHRFRNAKDRHQAFSQYSEHFAITSGNYLRNPQAVSTSHYVQIGHFHSGRGSNCSYYRSPRLLKGQLRYLETIGLSVSQSWLTILGGGKGSGKTLMLRTFASILGRDLQEITINPATDSTDLLGGFEQRDHHDKIKSTTEEVVDFAERSLRHAGQSPGIDQAFPLLRRLRRYLNGDLSLDESACLSDSVELLDLTLSTAGPPSENLRDRLLDAYHSRVGSQFQWVDGPLITAMKHGQWLLLDGANLCSPSVLDRLNSLCEPDGFITLNERGLVNGSVCQVKPHPNFRLFMTMDPQHGEMSRAMRNRGLEVFIIPDDRFDDSDPIRHYLRIPRSFHSPLSLGSTTFESVRRGLTKGQTKEANVVALGRSIEENFALNMLLDDSPKIITSNSFTEKSREAMLCFFTRTMRLAHSSLLRRYYTSRHSYELMSSLQRVLLTGNEEPFIQVHRALCERLGLQGDSILLQTIDPAMSPLLSARRHLYPHWTNHHRQILSLIDLRIAAMNIGNISDVETMIPIGSVGLDSDICQVAIALFRSLSTVIADMSYFWERDIDVPKVENTVRSLKFAGYLHTLLESQGIDFSALQAVSGWLVDSLSGSCSQMAPTLAAAKSLRASLSLTSGFGMIDLWKTFSRLALYRSYSSELDSAAASGDKEMKRKVLDLLAINELPPEFNTPNSYLQIANRNVGNDFGPAEPPTLWFVAETTFLHAALHLQNTAERDSLTNGISEIIKYGCDSLLPLRCVSGYRQFQWALQAEQDPSPFCIIILSKWMDGMWSSEMANGPGSLLQPIELLSCISHTCYLNTKTLGNITSYEDRLREGIQLVLLNKHQSGSRHEQLLAILNHSLSLLHNCFMINQPDTTDNAGVTKHFKRLQNSPYLKLAESARKYLSPLIASLEGCQSGDTYYGNDTPILGMCWVATSRLFLKLYVPYPPMDPVAVEICSEKFWTAEIECLDEQISLHQHLERLTSGNDENKTLEYLYERRAYATTKVPQDMRHLPKRNDASQSMAFWSEVYQFRNKVISEEAIDDIIKSLNNGESSAFERENLIQDSTARFLHRMDAVYPDLGDLLVPVKFALSHLRLGLRLVSQQAKNYFAIQKTQGTYALSLAACAYPTIRSVDRVFEIDGAVAGMNFDQILFHLSAAAVKSVTHESSSELAKLLSMRYEQGMRLWLLDEAREKDKERAAQTLYRHEESVSESDMHEGELLRMFPTFENVLDGPDPHQGSMAETTNQRTKLVSSEQLHRFLDIHYSLCFPSPNLSWNLFDNARFRFLDGIAQNELPTLSSNLDKDSFPIRLRLLKRGTQMIFKTNSSTSRPPNFYTEPSVEDVRAASIIVQSLKSRIVELLRKWPEQIVLDHILNHCDSVLQLHLTSPIAKVLSAVEQLLAKTDDWEIYSNKENSLKEHRDHLIQQIVSWRRLELSYWSILLDSEQDQFSSQVAEWIFRLYEALIQGSILACKESNFDVYLTNLIPLLDNFISTGPLGQFHSRMRLLRSFASFIEKYCPVEASAEVKCLKRVQTVILSTWEHFHYFEPELMKLLSSERAKLEKEINDFIKLASWRDVNVQALKQSAQRTHHQLYRTIRRFRDVLKQPIDSHFHYTLAEESEAHLPSTTTDTQGLADLLSDSHNWSSSSSLLNAVVSLRDVVCHRMNTVTDQLSGADLGRFAGEIIVTAKQLGGLALPADMPPERRSKHGKALLVRKRKALADLLRELKRAGVAANPVKEILERNADKKWLREQHSPAGECQPNCYGLYYLKVQGLLPELREAMSSHHQDISTRDLRRGLMFVESVFAMALESHSCCVHFAENCRNLKSLNNRLRMLYDEPQFNYHGLAVLDHVHAAQKTITSLSSALKDLESDVLLYSELNPEQVIPEDFRQEFPAVTQRTFAIQEDLGLICHNIGQTRLPVLLESECQVIVRAQHHCVELVGRLQIWSDSSPHLLRLFLSVKEWLVNRTLPPLESQERMTTLEIHPSIAHRFCSVVCTLEKCLTPDDTSKALPERDDYIRQLGNLATNVCDAFDLQGLTEQLHEACTSLFTAKPSVLRAELGHVLPLLQVYECLAEQQLDCLQKRTRSLFKLDYILCSVVCTLARDGFCKPPGLDDDSSSETGEGGLDGTGIGDGTGLNNASAEIQDESQVEGLRTDSAEEGDRQMSLEDEAIEMPEDFTGEMEDVHDYDADQTNHSDSESADAEERREDLPGDESGITNEKLLEDSKESESPRHSDEAVNQNASGDKTQTADIVAKEEQKDSERTEQEANQPQDSEGNSPNEAQQMEELPDDPEVEETPHEMGAPMPENIADTDALNLPDDLDLNLSNKDASDDQEPGKDDFDDGEEMNPTDGEDVEGDLENHSNDVEQEIDEPLSAPISDSLAMPVDENNPDEMAGETSQQELSSGPGDDKMEQTSRSSLDAGTFGFGHSIAGGDSQEDFSSNSAETDNAHKAQIKEADEVHPSPGDNDGDFAGNRPGSSHDANHDSQDNPLRSLGNALKDIRRRLDPILERSEKDALRDVGEMEAESSQLEYLRPDEKDSEMEALAPAMAEAAAKLDNISIVDGQAETDDIDSMEVDDDPTASDRFLHEESSERTKRQRDDGDTIEGLSVNDPGTRNNISSVPPTEATAFIAPDPATDETNDSLEVQVREWQACGQPEAATEQIWMQYASITHDLAFVLCEQLRLILEPTKATRLKGDYRTGKRLNMKKVISYIASDYTKDKIWLKRTKPSQREFQILIALDDSKSMAESHSVHLAYQTLSLVSAALTRLEAGEVAVARFGESVDIVHGFDDGPFSNQVGTNVLRAFRFDQKATNVLSLVEASLRALEEARERRSFRSSSSADLWQLGVIISDGMCQDHDEVRAVLRKAEEQKVLFVFIVVDSLHQAEAPQGGSSGDSSIISMNKVDFRNVGGKMELHMQRYLDSFPFEYYVVLRDVEALPEILCATLRQFFERIAET